MSPPRWVATAADSPRPKLRDGQEKGIGNSDKHKAAKAAEILGSYQLTMLEDRQAAEKSVRRCIELDPACHAAWDMLAAIMAKDQRYSEALDLCRQRLKLKDSAHNRLLLAKAYECLHQLDKAEEEVQEGLKRDPDDFLLNLALADLLLMRGEGVELEKARKLLVKVANDCRSESPGENRWINYTFACGIFYGLRDDVEQGRRCLKKIQKHEPENPRIEEALKALDEPGKPVTLQPRP